QLTELQKIQAAARDNGVELELWEGARAIALEPQLRCVGALHSPLTGIIDSHAYMLALLGQAESHGATLVCNSPVSGLRLEKDGVLLAINGAEPLVRARTLINSAGTQAPRVAALIEGFPAEQVPRA